MKQRSPGLDVVVKAEVNLSIEKQKSLALLNELFEISRTISQRKYSRSNELSKEELFHFALDFYNLYRFTKLSLTKSRTPYKSYSKVIKSMRTRVSRSKRALDAPNLSQMFNKLGELERSLNLHIKPTRSSFDKAWRSFIVLTGFLEFNSFEEEDAFLSSLEEFDLPAPTDNLPFIVFAIKLTRFFKGKSGVWEFLTVIRFWFQGRLIADLQNFKVNFEECQLSVQRLVTSFTKKNKNLVKKIDPFLSKNRA